jgi:uncharacterized protein YndB with AHSA1/START domain
MTESRSIQLAVEVPGTPEEVWEAIATGPGITSWFVPMEVDGRVGGQVVMDFGSYGTHTATVTAWEPPRRVALRDDDDRALAYEWLVEARDGGTCVVRLVNSGFGTGEGWDDDYEGMTSGWKIFLQNLRLHLQHFPGRRARPAIPTVTLPGPKEAAWSTLCAALGVPEGLGAGDRVTTSGDGVPVLGGTVETRMDSDIATTYLLVVDRPGPGTGFIAAEGNANQVACSVYLYLYETPAAVTEEWTAWLTSRLQPLRAHLEA